MDYAELALPPSLHGLVAAVWTATVPQDAGAWVEQEAVPDGCIELIRRHAGRSVWRREQPELFATGLATAPARLRLGAGARFTAVKLWPWAWSILAGPLPPADDWIDVTDAALAALLDGDAAEIPTRLAARFAGVDVPLLGRAILESSSVAEIAARTGMNHRMLQRLFARHFAMPPGTYLRLCRFGGAVSEVQASSETLADTAAAQGFADQAHMTREFRNLAGLPPGEARKRLRGPFI
jgi:AraC-like DNA-binding protein